ncbi:MAG TPA: WhiB family transcriptional regulator [Mycobacteriales bacterium]|jgi:DNA-binding NarL/FixJ family response regulator
MTENEVRNDDTVTRVPWERRAACAGRSAMFDDANRTGEALRLCARCPVLAQCRTWALTTAVAGVAGGMTEGSRAAWRDKHGFREPAASLADFLPLDVASIDQGWGKGRSAVILRAVAERTANGQSGAEIADELGVTRRTVCRLRTRCREEGLLDPYERVG